jgi:hypothetical protein
MFEENVGTIKIKGKDKELVDNFADMCRCETEVGEDSYAPARPSVPTDEIKVNVANTSYPVEFGREGKPFVKTCNWKIDANLAPYFPK